MFNLFLFFCLFVFVQLNSYRHLSKIMMTAALLEYYTFVTNVIPFHIWFACPERVRRGRNDVPIAMRL